MTFSSTEKDMTIIMSSDIIVRARGFSAQYTISQVPDTGIIYLLVVFAKCCHDFFLEIQILSR